MEVRKSPLGGILVGIRSPPDKRWAVCRRDSEPDGSGPESAWYTEWGREHQLPWRSAASVLDRSERPRLRRSGSVIHDRGLGSSCDTPLLVVSVQFILLSASRTQRIRRPN